MKLNLGDWKKTCGGGMLKKTWSYWYCPILGSPAHSITSPFIRLLPAYFPLYFFASYPREYPCPYRLPLLLCAYADFIREKDESMANWSRGD
jgi:hypothetical protein